MNTKKTKTNKPVTKLKVMEDGRQRVVRDEPKETITITKAEVGVLPPDWVMDRMTPEKRAEVMAEVAAFKPLSLDAQKKLQAEKEQKEAGKRKGPKAGMMFLLEADMQVVQTTENTADGAPDLMLKRVGKRKLTAEEHASVLPAGTQVEWLARKVVRTRMGTSKGEKIEVPVREDIIKFVGPPDADGQRVQHVIAAHRTMLIKEETVKESVQ